MDAEKEIDGKSPTESPDALLSSCSSSPTGNNIKIPAEKIDDETSTPVPDVLPSSCSSSSTTANSNLKNNGSTTAVATAVNKCSKCQKRLAREGCTQMACLNCCSDLDGCETHKKPRAQALLKEQILAGTTETQKLAAAKRRMRIPETGRFFREPGFVYQGDTVVIWDLRAYASNPKWREDALRKSIRRKRARSLEAHRPPLRTSRKRFHRIVEKFHHQSLKVKTLPPEEASETKQPPCQEAEEAHAASQPPASDRKAQSSTGRPLDGWQKPKSPLTQPEEQPISAQPPGSPALAQPQESSGGCRVH